VFQCRDADEDHCYLNRFSLHGIRWFPESSVDE